MSLSPRKGRWLLAISPPAVIKLGDLVHDLVAVCFAALAKKERLTGKNQKPYVKCTFRDNHCSLVAMIWSDHSLHDIAKNWPDGSVFRLKVQGDQTASYGMQIKILEARFVEDRDVEEGYNFADLLEWSDRHPDKLYAKLVGYVESDISDPFLKTLVLSILGDNVELLKKMPAAKKFHHSYNGGLLEHIWSMTRIAVLLSKHYHQYYSKLDPRLNQSLVIAGTILHDIGKLRELEYDPFEARYTTAGSLLGHIVMGRDMVCEAASKIEGFPKETLLQLEHAILAHHGKRDFGSPVIPSTIEALLLSFIDDLDAKMNQAARALLNTPPGPLFTEKIYALDNRSLYRGASPSTESQGPASEPLS